MSDLVPKMALGLLPAAVFLGCLVLLDSYKLVRMRAVLTALGAGIVALLVCRVVNVWLFSLPHDGGARARLRGLARRPPWLIWRRCI